MITLRFATCRDMASHAVRAFQYGFWASHVDAVVDGKFLGSHFIGGVKAREPGYDAKGLVREVMVSIPADDSTVKAFDAFLTDQIGKPYDVKAIAGLVLDRDWRDPSAWICSELIAEALIRCQRFPPFPVAVDRVLPRDLFLIASVISK